MIKTFVTPQNKATPRPHPKVGGVYAPGAYNDVKQKGHDITFIPSSSGVSTKKAKILPRKKI